MSYKITHYTLIFFISLALTSSALAETPSAKQPPSPKPTDQLPVLYCPPIDKIYKTSNSLWESYYGGTWKSYYESFANELEVFKGAQWKGVGIGNIVCIYIAKNKSTFPINLAYSVLVRNPTETKSELSKTSKVPIQWEQKSYMEGGQKQIISSCTSKLGDPRDCPFMPGILQKKEDVNEALKNTRENYSPLKTPNL